MDSFQSSIELIKNSANARIHNGDIYTRSIIFIMVSIDTLMSANKTFINQDVLLQAKAIAMADGNNVTIGLRDINRSLLYLRHNGEFRDYISTTIDKVRIYHAKLSDPRGYSPPSVVVEKIKPFALPRTHDKDIMVYAKYALSNFEKWKNADGPKKPKATRNKRPKKSTPYGSLIQVMDNDRFLVTPNVDHRIKMNRKMQEVYGLDKKEIYLTYNSEKLEMVILSQPTNLPNEKVLHRDKENCFRFSIKPLYMENETLPYVTLGEAFTSIPYLPTRGSGRGVKLFIRTEISLITEQK